MQAGLRELKAALATDQPIPLTDSELLDLAESAAEELRRRLPRYALDQGDIDDESGVEAREDLLDGIRDARERIEG